MSAAEFQRRLACAWIEGDNEITSGFRTPQENERVRGAPNSQHLIGQAVDVVGPDLAALERSSRECGLVPVPSRTHLHIQLETADRGDILEAEEAAGVEPEQLPEIAEVPMPGRKCVDCGLVRCGCGAYDPCDECGSDPCVCAALGPADEEPWWLRDDPCDDDED